MRFVADLFEEGGEDLRALPLTERRGTAALVPRVDLPHPASRRSWRRPTGWPGRRETSRERGVEGLMLKRRDAAYGAGRVRGLVEVEGGPLHHRHRRLRPARPGAARPSTPTTPAVIEEGELVPVAKAYSA